MKTNKIISLAIFALLPIAANAENISGAMYTAPTAADTNHPAPTTQADAPYGRANIDTTDQEHIATTAYVKGAYNSAIAAVNKVDSDKQTKLVNTGNNHDMDTRVTGADSELLQYIIQSENTTSESMNGLMAGLSEELNIDYDDTMISTEAVIKLAGLLGDTLTYTTQEKIVAYINGDEQEVNPYINPTIPAEPSAFTLVSEAAVADAINGVTTNLNTNYVTNTALNSKRVEIYTTWDDDDTAEVALITAQQ